MRIAIITTLLLAACGRAGDSHPAASSTLDLLRAERAVRLAATVPGWPSRTDCDGLLWASLAKAAGVSVDLSEAESAPGVLHRRPLDSGECYPAESASTISNDMLWGYLLGAGPEALTRLADYGETHEWVMGQPFPEMAARVLAKPNLIIAIGRKTGRWYGTPPCILAPPIADFEQHLHLLAALSCGQTVDITINSGEENDALAALLADDAQRAVALLMNPDYQAPSYVRGSAAYANIHWLFAAAVALGEVR